MSALTVITIVITMRSPGYVSVLLDYVLGSSRISQYAIHLYRVTLVSIIGQKVNQL